MTFDDVAEPHDTGGVVLETSLSCFGSDAQLFMTVVTVSVAPPATAGGLTLLVTG